MTDIPILMKPEMVSALLDGRKTQTRRLAWRECKNAAEALRPDAVSQTVRNPDGVLEARSFIPTRWQKVMPGDRLWVREKFSKHVRLEDPYYLPPDYHDAALGAHYWADGDPKVGDWEKPKPSIFMPRWASRLTLVVTDVQLQRLWEITEADAKVEGCDPVHSDKFGSTESGFEYRVGFARLWEFINAKRAPWHANPEVVTLTFTVHHCNIDAMPEAA